MLANNGATVFGGDIAPATADDTTFPELNVTTTKCDVTAEQNVIHLIEMAAAQTGKIDILVNNAGIAIGVSLEGANDEDYEASWSRTFDVLLTAQVRLVRACLPHLMRRGEGRIINIASTEGIGASAGTSPYTAAKHGVVGLTLSLIHT